MSFVSLRDSLIKRPGIHGGEQRSLLTQSMDTWLDRLFHDSMKKLEADPADFALVAVGSYGRGEPTLRSDVDLVLIHKPKAQYIQQVASEIWYPIWNSGVVLDHSVRTVAQARKVAAHDLKVVTGLLDARFVSGNSELSHELRTHIHSDWRKFHIKMIPELRELISQRRARSGDLFQLLEPDLKDSYGGLRDAGILRALGATWRAEIALSDWQESNEFLLNVRTQLHHRSSSDRLRLQDQGDIAHDLGFETADELLRSVFMAGRRIAYSSDRAWNQIERGSQKRDMRRPLADGVVSQNGEVVLARSSASKLESSQDRTNLELAVAAAAAINKLPVSPALLKRFRDTRFPIPTVWNSAMRESLLIILGSRYGMLNIWESLDQFDIVSRWLPEWEHVRSLPQFNALHEFTVDRHLIECVVQAQALTGEVRRPDLLLMGCLLHDIGKGYEGDHSLVGAEIARSILDRLQFPASDIDTVELLVRDHLVLAELATHRDIDDPAVVSELCDRLRTRENIELLLALTIADSRATGPSLRSQWRENLLREAAERAMRQVSGERFSFAGPSVDLPQLAPDSDGMSFQSDNEFDGFRISVSYPDQMGLLAAVAGVFAMHRLRVRAADVRGDGLHAIQIWRVQPLFGDLPDESLLRRDIKRALSGELDLVQRLGSSSETDETLTVTITHVSEQQTALEVRAHDRKALLFDISRAISDCDLTITGARISTLGLNAVDVFFIRDSSGQTPSDSDAERLVSTIYSRLSP